MFSSHRISQDIPHLEQVVVYCDYSLRNQSQIVQPTVPKPERTIVEHVDKTRKCSYCKETGHEKSRNGEILCPMMPKWHDIKHYRYHCLIASRPFLGNSDGIDESITTRFFSNLNSFSKESQYSCRIQKGCSSYLIIILYIVFLFFVIIPTLSQLTYFFQVKWRHYSAETLQDIAQSVTDSFRYDYLHVTHLFLIN
jgi:hypothetical protein